MQTTLLHQLNVLIDRNDKLIEIYRSIYYLLPAKENVLLKKIWSLFEKREELDLKLRECFFNIRNSIQDEHCQCADIIKLMPFLLSLEGLARLNFKGTNQHRLYLEEKKFLKKYFELLYKEDLSNSVFELLLKYKRRHKSFH